MTEKSNNKMTQLIEKALTDESFKEQLLKNPLAIFKAEGIEVPPGLEIKILEDSDKVFHLVLPPNPSELSDDELDKVAGGCYILPGAPISADMFVALVESRNG